METLVQDVKYGVRMMLRSPGFTAVALVALALGIGANTAIFSVVNSVLLRPLSFADSDRLVFVYHSYTGLHLSRISVSPQGFNYYREHSKTLEQLSAFSGYRAPQNLTGSGEPERVRPAMVTGDFFNVLGVPAALGRNLTPNDDQPGHERVAVLSYA